MTALLSPWIPIQKEVHASKHNKDRTSYRTERSAHVHAIYPNETVPSP